MRLLALACLLALPLFAQAQEITGWEYVAPDVRYESTPATGPVVDYEACIHRPGQETMACGNVLNGAVFHLRVRALDAEGETGPWSLPARIVYIPEPGSLLLLVAGVGGLGVVWRVRG